MTRIAHWTDSVMDHDLRTLQVFMERQFEAMSDRANRMHEENQSKLTSLEQKADTTNGRVRALEKAQAVLMFAVYTIGGTILITGIQLALQKWGGN